MDDLLSEFLTETQESIEIVDNEVVRLEQDPNNKEVLDNIFRLVHTIKGTCGFLGLPRLEAVAHAGENVLGKFRDGEIKVTPSSVTVILESLDRIKEILDGLEKTEEEPQGDDSELVAKLDAIIIAAMEGGEIAAVVREPVPEPDFKLAEITEKELRPGEVSMDELEAAFANAPGPDETDAEAVEEVAEDVVEEVVAEVVADAPVAAAADAGKADTGKADAPRSNQSIRVSVDLLEDLMNMVSELVLTRNQLMQMVRQVDDSEFGVPLQRLNQCTTELQESVMKTRMQPIGNAWAKLPRIIRDLNMELGKKVELVMIGEDTELDRQVLELIKDPLTHMVRNSADHGVETPEVRVAAGKPEEGKVTLNAYHEGGHIIIEIKDDGAGLPVEKLKQKALDSGIATESELEQMSDAQVQKFIFHAGFSTAKKVTSVSGRGVGMDVVRTNIEKIGGTIDLQSAEGKGTTFKIKIPLTLAIVSALIVQASDERFAIPQLSVLELVKASANSEHTIESIKDTPVLRLRNRLLPLVYLNEVLGFDTREDTHEKETTEDQFIVVTQVGAFTFGIVVNQVFDTEEIVVKPVAPILKHLEIYSGNTILGDGSVIMILDPNGIANQANQSTADVAAEAEEQARSALKTDEREAMLVFRGGNDTPKAVPLALVSRLEDIDVSEIEESDGRYLVQYRGALMPLVPVRGMDTVAKEDGRRSVLVFSDRGKTMGLAVDEILDIVEETLDVELASDASGMIGSAIIAEHATEIIDVAYYLGIAFSSWLQPAEGEAPSGDADGSVLLIDDSGFFRNMIKPLLTAAGYKVATATTAEEALKYRDDGHDFDLIVSDIEMPGMDGYEFAETVKAEGRWRETPLVALSNHTNEKDFARGREVGFSDYVAKFDRDALLLSLSQQMHLRGDAA